MTIAAGFSYDGGLLFCVDTKVSTQIKTNESKLLHYRYADGACATTFAISSDDLSYARSACESCRDAVSKIDFASASIESVRKVIQAALGKFYTEYIFPHPDRSAGALYVQLLIGIWLKQGTRLFASHESLLEPVDEYECIGSGAYLAKYWIRQYRGAIGKRLTLEDVALIASHSVESAIDYDENCGGEAEMLIIKDSGEVEEICDSVLYPGYMIKPLQQATLNLLHDIAQIKDDLESETDYALEKYFDRIKAIRASNKWTMDSVQTKKNREKK